MAADSMSLSGARPVAAMAVCRVLFQSSLAAMGAEPLGMIPQDGSALEVGTAAALPLGHGQGWCSECGLSGCDGGHASCGRRFCLCPERAHVTPRASRSARERSALGRMTRDNALYSDPERGARFCLLGHDSAPHPSHAAQSSTELRSPPLIAQLG